MKTSKPNLIGLLLLSCFLSSMAIAEDWARVYEDSRSGTNVQFMVSAKRLFSETNQWNPTEPLPIDLSAFAERAREHLSTNSNLRAPIELNGVIVSKGFGVWILVFSFRFQDTYPTKTPKQNVVVMLLDGTIAETRYARSK